MDTLAGSGADAFGSASGSTSGDTSGRFGNVAGVLLWTRSAGEGAGEDEPGSTPGEAMALLRRVCDETVSRPAARSGDPRSEAIRPQDVAELLRSARGERVLLLVCEADWRPSADWAERLLAMLCWPAADALVWRGDEVGLLFFGVLEREAALGCLAETREAAPGARLAAAWFSSLDPVWVDLEALGLGEQVSGSVAGAVLGGDSGGARC